MLTLGKETIVHLADLRTFLEKEKDWYFSLFGSNQAFELFKDWLSMQPETNLRNSQIQAMIAKHRYHVDKKYLKEALFRMINPQRDIRIKTHHLPFNTQDVRSSFLEHIAFIFERWDNLTIDDIRFGLFQLEASLTQIEQTEKCPESKRVLDSFFAELRKYQNYQGKVPFPNLKADEASLQRLTKSIINIYQDKASVDILVNKVFAASDGKYYLNYGIKKTLRPFLQSIGQSKSIASEYVQKQMLWEPDRTKSLANFRAIAKEASNQLKEQVLQSEGIAIQDLTPSSLNYEENGLLNSFVACEKLLYDCGKDFVQHELALNNFTKEPGTGDLKVGYSLQSNLRQYLKKNDLTASMQGSWMTYFYYPDKTQLKDFVNFKKGLIQDTATRHNYPRKDAEISLKTDRALAAAFQKNGTNRGSLAKLLILGSLLIVCTVAASSLLNTKESEDRLDSSTDSLSTEATPHLGNPNTEVRQPLALLQDSEAQHKPPFILRPELLEGLSLIGSMHNDNAQTLRITLSNVATMEGDDRKLLFDYNVNHKDSRGRDNTGGSQLAGAIDLQTKQIYFDNFYLGQEKIRLRKGKITSNDNGHLSVVSLRGSPEWKLSSQSLQ